ncbi:MAG: 2-oxoacid:acceptor oxidoreductase subunit alpha [Youngiibacter sp.]|nr:2-oxoacid:acceptor oxidoreductase subunit alpha [Youngiibacter sp.]
MKYNILIGGAAGQGMETLSSLFAKLLQRNGYHIFTLQDYMSRVRGGHNFFQIRFGDEEVKSHSDELDGIIALNDETLVLHSMRLKSTGFIICDDEVTSDDPRRLSVPSKHLATEAGNPKAASSVQLGALAGLFGLDALHLDTILIEKFDEKVAKENLAAFGKGLALTQKRFDIGKGPLKGQMLVHGNDSIALGALAAGMKFYSAYPMTPSTSIMSYLVKRARKAKIVVEQAEDEIAAINMAIGASYAGARAMTGTSGGGYSLMVEAVGLAGITETPLVIAEIQRPGPATGLPTRTEQSDLRFVISSSHGEFPKMVIALRNPKDAFLQTARAFNLADKYQLPVILLGDQYLADCTRTIEPFDLASVEVDRHLADTSQYSDDITYSRYKVTDSGISPRLIPGLVPGTSVNSDSDEHDENGNITESAEVRIMMVDKRERKFQLLRSEVQEPEYIGIENPDVLLVAWGSLDSPVKEALDILKGETDKSYGALVFGDIWPLPQRLLLEKAQTAKKVVNVEQNHGGQLASLIMQETGIRMDHSILRYNGRPMSGSEIAARIKEALK